MIKKLLAVVFMLAIAVVWIGCGGLSQSAIAEVDGKVITKNDFDKAVNETRQQYGAESVPATDSQEYDAFRKQIAERLVIEEVIWHEADKMGVTAKEEDINMQVDTYRQQAGGEEQFENLLKENNLTLDALRDNVRKSLLFQGVYKEATSDIPEITDEEALKYYNEHPAEFQAPETRKVSHILVADEATANKAKARLDAGEDFAAVAREMSTDPGSKDKGGALGDVPSRNSGFVPEFEQAMNQLAAGQTSGLVKSQLGYHIIRVESITPSGKQTFEEAKDQLKMGLKLKKERAVFDKWILDAKGKYEIIYAEEYDPGDSSMLTRTTTGTQTQAAPEGTAGGQ